MGRARCRSRELDASAVRPDAHTRNPAGGEQRLGSSAGCGRDVDGAFVRFRVALPAPATLRAGRTARPPVLRSVSFPERELRAVPGSRWATAGLASRAGDSWRWALEDVDLVRRRGRHGRRLVGRGRVRARGGTPRGRRRLVGRSVGPGRGDVGGLPRRGHVAHPPRHRHHADHGSRASHDCDDRAESRPDDRWAVSAGARGERSSGGRGDARGAIREAGRAFARNPGHRRNGLAGRTHRLPGSAFHPAAAGRGGQGHRAVHGTAPGSSHLSRDPRPPQSRTHRGAGAGVARDLVRP